MNFSKMILAGTALLLTGTIAQAARYHRGTVAFGFNRTNDVMTVDGVQTDLKSGELADFPVLNRNFIFLSSVDRGVETSEGNFELYAGSRMFAAVRIGDEHEQPSILWSRGNRHLGGVMFVRGVSETGVATSALSFTMQECHALPANQDQQAQEQGQEQGQEILPAGEGEECKELVVTKSFEQIVSEKEKHGEKGQDQQDQTKN